MDKSQIRNKLRDVTRNRGIRLPEDMGFDFKDGVLAITLFEKGVIGNMQDNVSAFEGWALSLKAWLPEIKKVSIAWVSPSVATEHYERFLYRVVKFVRAFDWATTKSPHDNYSTNGFVLNYPSQAAKKDAAHKEAEAEMERKYVKVHNGEYDAMNHQLPVGIFNKEVSSLNGIMPRGGSQIDIWAIKSEELTVFELKKDNNKKVGIISELMFYCNIMDDLMSHRINYTTDAECCTDRSFDKLYHAYKNRSIKVIHGVFLANNLHSLISPEVIQLINTATGRIKYSHRTI